MPARTRADEGARKGASRKLDSDLDADLDRALAQTFPASDPFSVGRFTSTEPPARPVDRQAPRPEIAQPSRRKGKTRRA